ncbi:unnamed protein product [Closterium sp. Naga37s-1]|nr:unnamed protein product [Closterium sp. Naga37s-1]
MKYCFAVWFPTTPALFKEYGEVLVASGEYGEVLVASGCVGEAMRVFETNELWDHLIDCYSLMGKRAAAVALVTARLKHSFSTPSHPPPLLPLSHPSLLGKRAAAAALVTARLKEQKEDPRLCLLGKRAAAAALVTARLKEQKEDPRLWCCLGDLTEKKECYEKAWEFSRHRYARAQRALARMAMNSKDFKAAMAHWEAALAISPLHASAWFSLGYSAIQACDGDKALYALTRSVQIDPDNGEAWNNLAVL